ncbi:MAG TPA: Crp/Fnr family transcriptional regulator [Ramlibacter sp.]|nr:Crp/Fnr family transcriptional regulator [Ramlibacter sp.]
MIATTPAAQAYASWDAARTLTAPWLQAKDLGELQQLPADTVLFRQGERSPHFFLVREGFVHTTILRGNGAAILLEILGPGALVGEGPAFANLPRSVTARAVTALQVSRYQAGELEAVLAQRPQLALALVRLLGSKNWSTLRKLTRIASADPQERVLELLARVARLEAVSSALPRAVDLTHETIAAMTALSRVTVTRTLKVLAARGLVATEPGRVVIRDRAELLRLLDAK